MKKLLAFSFLVAVIPVALKAQTKDSTYNIKAQKRAAARAHTEKLIKQEEEGALIYQKQTVFGLKLNTDGYGLVFEKAKLKTAEKASLWNLELGERRDAKEYKLQAYDNSGFATGNGVVYGKIANFYYLKAGIGQSILLGGKGNRNGVAVTALYSGGVTLALLKPYYLNVRTPSGVDSTVKYMGGSSPTDRDFTNSDSVYSSAGFFKGIGEVKIKPGLQAKAALRFDYGHYNETVSAIEVGLDAEYYFSKIPFLLIVPQHQFFINAFVAIEFGKRK
jgi:hypothetical protein